ncbi:MAG: hypothetical protein WBA16_08850 [Nonlabens sp.]
MNFAYSQEVTKKQISTFPSSLFELNVSYGIQGNFFVDYGESVVKAADGDIIPFRDAFGFNLYQKEFIGDYKAIRFSTRLGGRNFLELGYEVGTNRGEFSIITQTDSGTRVVVNDFELDEVNRYFSLTYKRGLGKTNRWFLLGAVSYLHLESSTIEISPSANFISVEESNPTNSYLEELAGQLGVQYYFYNSGRFSLGLETRAYFIISYGPELETWSFAPILKYNF